MTKDQNLKAPAPAPSREPAVQSNSEGTYESLVAAHLIAAAPGRYLENTRLEGSLSGATCDLYQRLAPRDAQESLLSLLAVSVANASLDCFALAARVSPDNLPVRDLNYRHGFKGAELAAGLLKACWDRRREKPDKVTVGAVNVEAGGQAIVGTVNSGRDSVPTKDPKE
jgi:hypothetical protein